MHLTRIYPPRLRRTRAHRDMAAAVHAAEHGAAKVTAAANAVEAAAPAMGHVTQHCMT